MPTTVAQEIINLRIDLDDPTGIYWQTADYLVWMNDAQLDIARRAECLMEYAQTSCAANVARYAAPSDAIRLHEVTYSPNDPSQIYPLSYKGRQELNGIWWVNQSTPATYPLYYTTWSQPPFIMVQLFPVPSQIGQLAFWYYRLPIPVANTTDTIDIPAGY